jgi:hypothetical protein
MDWPTIITSVTGSGVAMAAVTWMAKQSFEKILESRLRAAEERSKALSAETLRRQATAYDKAFDTLRMATSLCYRARNKAREISDEPESIIFGRRRDDRRNAVRALSSYHEALQELLFQERALIPSDAFEFLHDQKHALYGFLAEIEAHSKRPPPDQITPEKKKLAIERIERSFKHLDEGYQEFTRKIEGYFHPEP